MLQNAEIDILPKFSKILTLLDSNILTHPISQYLFVNNKLSFLTLFSVLYYAYHFFAFVYITPFYSILHVYTCVYTCQLGIYDDIDIHDIVVMECINNNIIFTPQSYF